MNSHAANPVPYILDKNKGLVRIFFTTRNLNNQSYIGFVDIDFFNDFEIVRFSEKPVISPGPLGMFDDSGAAMGYLIEHNKKFYLFYLGWNLKVTVPWLNTIGLATSDSIDGEFKKVSMAPIMDRSNEDPFSISYPSIIQDENIFKMWYGSNLNWGKDQSEMEHVIKYAESNDLINWKRTNETHINLEHKNEYAISKPWVIKDSQLYRMWYSYRANGNIDTYRIGYAESRDSRNWLRKDQFANIDISDSGWDSEMICYPAVFTLNFKTYMLYNGNGFGKTGFGLAILE
jgi:hypothetical protein